ncbi:MAG TPA: LemA family protein, partial [Acidimicrobiales bacterium]|nr:LemA family protein [Acidimicrobiales bacterium]
IVWERSTGRPVGPGLGWQDLRTVGECIVAKAEHGIPLAPNQSATKLAWLLANAAGDRDARVEAANQFDSALSRLLVSVEAYPQLQATQAFRDFMTQIEGTENRISTSRRDYNQAVLAYNLKVRRFPGNLLAGLFGFDPAESFEAAEGADRAPVVDFSRSSAAASSASL